MDHVTITIFALGIAFFLIFYKPISRLIDRIRSISKSGITTDTNQRDAVESRDPRAEAEALMRDLDSALLREVETGINNELRPRNLLGAEAVPVLVKYLAGWQIAFHFEETYGLIWGSQINLLNYLNPLPGGTPRELARTFYTLSAAQYPEAYSGYSFEAWLGFLISRILIRDDNGQLRITVRGREFLAYLTRIGRSLNKAY